MRADGTARPGDSSRRAGGSHVAARRTPSWLPTVAVVLLVLTGTAAGLRLVGVSGEGRGGSSPDTATTAASEGRSEVVVRIGDDGALRVQQRVTLRAPVRSLELAVPRRQGVTATLDPRIDGVTIEAAGRELTLGRTLRPGDRASVSLPEQTTQAVVRYAATGVALRSEPSTPERALVLATPLVLGQAKGLPSRVDIESPKALNVGCVDLAGTMRGCGTKTSSGWTVQRSGTEPYADVVVQLNLAAP